MSYYWNHCCLYCRFVMKMLTVQSLMEIIVVLVQQAGMEDDVIKI